MTTGPERADPGATHPPQPPAAGWSYPAESPSPASPASHGPSTPRFEGSPIRYSDLPPRDLPLLPRSVASPPPEVPAVRARPEDPGQSSLSGGAAAGERRRRRQRMMPLWQELPLLLLVAFFMAVLVRTFLLQAFWIPSVSMEDTLLVGDRVLVNKIVYDVRLPNRGEVVVFRGTDKWAPEVHVEPGGGLFDRMGRTFSDLIGISRPGEKDFIKRVIGLPGDRVSCCDAQGRVYVNGTGLDEPYVINNSPLEPEPIPGSCSTRRFDEVLVPPGHVFVMGDNRNFSADSRCQGTVPVENIIGRALVIVWPKGRWTSLSVPETFASIPGPVALGASDATPVQGDWARWQAEAAFVVPLLAAVGWAGRAPRLTTLAATAGRGDTRRRRARTLRR